MPISKPQQQMYHKIYDPLCFQVLKLTLGVLKVPLFLEDGHDGDKAKVDQQEGSGQEQLQPPWKYNGQDTKISIRDYTEIIKALLTVRLTVRVDPYSPFPLTVNFSVFLWRNTKLWLG